MVLYINHDPEDLPYLGEIEVIFKGEVYRWTVEGYRLKFPY